MVELYDMRIDKRENYKEELSVEEKPSDEEVIEETEEIDNKNNDMTDYALVCTIVKNGIPILYEFMNKEDAKQKARDIFNVM
jgi:hypothetical protein